MNFFETIEARKSIRKFTNKNVPAEVMQKAFDAAILAPNSSNAQTTNIYWLKSEDKKKKLVEYCLNQSAARTAQELVVIVASPKDWKRSHPYLVQFVKSVSAPKPVVLYYEKLLPLMYKWGFLNSLGLIKWTSYTLTGLVRPIMRNPTFKRSIQEVCIKSAALASENFVLALAAQGFQSCMMEGMDEVRIKRLLKLRCSDRVVMVIAVGEEGERGTWGPRFRIPRELVIKEV